MFKLLIISVVVSYVSANGYAIPAALKSKWDLDIRDVHLPQEPIEPQIIEVPALELPVKIIYKSKSSGVSVQQVHQQGERGQVESTKSEEEPHRVIHEVVRPVIQELREVIVPYRRVIQEIQPVIEQVQTTVARGQGRENNAGEGGSVVLSGGLSGMKYQQDNDNDNGNSYNDNSDNGNSNNGNSNNGDSYGRYGDLWRAAKAAAAAAKSKRA